jgi:hypothetical protein
MRKTIQGWEIGAL